MRKYSKIFLFVVFLFMGSLVFALCGSEDIKFQKLQNFIQETLFVDVHCHPAAGVLLKIPEKLFIAPYPDA
ncbi:MAG: hypothetical protein ACLFVG_05075 [Candidatus Aminicenantes bacterium]